LSADFVGRLDLVRFRRQDMDLVNEPRDARRAARSPLQERSPVGAPETRGMRAKGFGTTLKISHRGGAPSLQAQLIGPASTGSFLANAGSGGES
jgi:hypothetical protein